MFTILGYVFAILLLVVVLTQIIMWCVNAWKEDKYDDIHIKFYTFWNSFDGMYIIPTISVGKNGPYIDIIFHWLGIVSTCDIHISTESETEAEAEARINAKKQ